MTLKELEETIAQLPPEELARFREWFLEFDAARWDDQIEADARAGRLDSLGDAAVAEHRDGRTKPL